MRTVIIADKGDNLYCPYCFNLVKIVGDEECFCCVPKRNFHYRFYAKDLRVVLSGLNSQSKNQLFRLEPRTPLNTIAERFKGKREGEKL